MKATNFVNVASQSTSGHFLEGAEKVVCLDGNKDYFAVKGPAVLTTKNHTTLKVEGSCIVFPQLSVNPVSGLLERMKD